jgi:hypothetical protein
MVNKAIIIENKIKDMVKNGKRKMSSFKIVSKSKLRVCLYTIAFELSYSSLG